MNMIMLIIEHLYLSLCKRHLYIPIKIERGLVRYTITIIIKTSEREFQNKKHLF